MRKRGSLYYAYPVEHFVSFSIVARQHVKHLKQLGYNVYELDGSLLPTFAPVHKLPLIIHPLFFNMVEVLKARMSITGTLKREYVEQWLSRFAKIIGVDVADSSRISKTAVKVANYTTACVVPSSFAREVYVKSGVKVPVYVVYHGVEDYWYTRPNLWKRGKLGNVNPAIIRVRELKEREGVKVLLFWLWHSPDRKGWPEVKRVYRLLKQERRDAMLVIVTMTPTPYEVMEVSDLGVVNVYGVLSEESKMALYDLADATLVFSRGGGFEMCALESLARGTPALTVDWGPFKEYVPPEFRLKKGYRVEVLPGNEIHVGYGYTVDVNDAVSKLLDLLEKPEDWREKCEEWREKVLKGRFTWRRSAEQLAEVLEKTG